MKIFRPSETTQARIILVIFVLLCVAIPIFFLSSASAESTSTDLSGVSDTSSAPAPEFAFKFRHTDDWSNQVQELLTITIIDKYQSGWAKAEVRIDGDAWENITSDVTSENTYKFYVWKNCTVTVRVTDKLGNQHTGKTVIDFFDLTDPTVTAGIRNTLLHVEAADGQSGVAGVRVNDLLFSTLVDGTLDVQLQERLNAYDKLIVYAIDHAGNQSQTVTLVNPYYVPEATKPPATPTPTATPKPTKKPSSGNSGNSGSAATKKPQATATPEPTALPVVTPYIVGPGEPFINPGNMNTLDMLYSAHSNKQFITVQSKNGETYYMVIDYDKPIDEAGEQYETYFLNLVDDRDLLDVIAEEDLPTPTPTVVPTPVPTAVPVVTEPPQEEADGNSQTLLIGVIGLAALGGIGFWFMKNKGQNRQAPMESEYDGYDDDEAGEELVDAPDEEDAK